MEMKKHIRWNALMILAVIVSLICACTTTGGDPVPENEFQSNLKLWNKEHKTLATDYYTNLDVAAWTKSLKESSDLVSEEECKALLNTKRENPRNSVLISVEQAREDTDLLFRLFKSFYGAYEFFGGDEVFVPATEKALAEIEKYGTQISTKALNEILLENFSFIVDGHMSIGDTRICDYNGMNIEDYYLDGYYFDKDDLGYYSENAGQRYYLVSVLDDPDVDKYMKVTIDGEGRLCYMVLISVNSNSPLLVKPELVVHTENTETVYSFSWKKFVKRATNQSKYSCKITLDDNIPCIRIRGNNASDDLDTGHVQKLGDKINKQNVAIIDVYGNLGYRYIFGLGQLYENNIECFKLSKTAERLGKKNMPWHQGSINSYFVRIFTPEFKRNKSIRFVIQDRNNFSALEGTVIAYRSVENTIFVGGRTGGGQICATNQQMVLPNSRLYVHMGATLVLSLGKTESIDGVGLEPDIWVNPIEAEDAIRRLCSYYQIENNVDTSALKKLEI